MKLLNEKKSVVVKEGGEIRITGTETN